MPASSVSPPNFRDPFPHFPPSDNDLVIDNIAELINRLTEHDPQIWDTLEEERREKEPGINEQGIIEEQRRGEKRGNTNQGAAEVRRALEGQRFEDQRRPAEEQRRNLAQLQSVKESCYG